MRWIWPLRWKAWVRIMSKNILTVLMLILFFPFSGQASNYNISTIKGLADACQNVVNKQNNQQFDEMGYGLCFGYMRGIKNTYDAQRIAAGRNHNGSICYPDGVTWLQLINVYLKWSEDHPEVHNESAWSGTVFAMKKAFPCDFGTK